MKFAIVGAPESGKTAVAKSVARRLRKDGLTVKIIDNYVDGLTKTTDLAYGHFATYQLNFQLLFYRWTLEQEAVKDGYDVILTCGSIYETTTYCLLCNNRTWVKTPEDVLAHVIGKTCMEFMSTIDFLISDYYHIFRLPYTDKKLSEKGDSWDTVIDKKLPEVIDGYFKYATVLDGTQKENTDLAINIINNIRESAAILESKQSTI
jgi:hypothetical protein